jgi:hypothetical protein
LCGLAAVIPCFRLIRGMGQGWQLSADDDGPPAAFERAVMEQHAGTNKGQEKPGIPCRGWGAHGNLLASHLAALA